MAEWMPFNVNYYVRVKLTPFGISVLHNAHEALRKRRGHQKVSTRISKLLSG